MRRLIFGVPRKPPSEHPIEAGDLCMALPLPEQQAGSADAKKRYLATVVDYKKKRVVFFDDGSESAVTVAAISEASRADRDAAKARYSLALSEAKAVTALMGSDVIDAAIEQVKAAMGGTLGADGAISYTAAAGDESREAQLLCDALIGTLRHEPMPIRRTHSECTTGQRAQLMTCAPCRC